MRRSYSKIFLVLCLILPLWLTLLQCGKKTKVKDFAPDFTLKTIEGQEITLSTLKGNVILLDFWATWCGPCRESIPHLIQIHKTYQGEGGIVIGMSMDRGGIDMVRHFVKSMEIPYPIIITPDSLARNYGVTGLPTTIFIDKKGRIRGKITGFSNSIAKQMVASIEELISEKE